MNKTIRYIDTPEALQVLCEEIRQAPWLALDTEFLREKSYYPRLCLIQLATEETIACVDPIALADLEPLWLVIYDPAILKILHSAGQDLEIFHHLRGELPTPLFDTQIAASLLNREEQIGYGALVQRLLGVELEKGQTRTDWSQRPLEPEQIEYAADDVRHLGEIWRRQREMLSAQGRESWLEEDFRELADPARYHTDPRQAWRRVKDHRKLKGRQLAVLQELAAWREERARRLNHPRRWVLRDEVLVELARRMPENEAGLLKVRGLEAAAVKKMGRGLLEAIRRGGEKPREQWPDPAATRRLDSSQEATLDALSAAVRLIAAREGLSPAMLAGRKVLEQFLLGDPASPLRHGWRHALAGETLQELLEGRMVLRIGEDGPELLETGA